MTFRKLAAASAGKLLRAYFTEGTPETARDPARRAVHAPSLVGARRELTR